MSEKQFKKVPVMDRHSIDMENIVGSLNVEVDFGKLISDGLVRFDPCIQKNQDGTFELIEISLVPNFTPFEDKSLHQFFKELRQLCKDEINEGDSVCPVVIAKLKLLEAAKEMKLGIPYITSKGYIEFARARFELNEEETEAIRKVVHGAQDRRSREKRGGGS